MNPVTGLNTGNARAIVVNAVGNNGTNGYYYPARCNDFNPKLTRKDLFITVANSISSTTIDPACANATTLDQRCGGTTIGINNTSNYGPWVDIAAPGMSIRTTNAGGGTRVILKFRSNGGHCCAWYVDTDHQHRRWVHNANGDILVCTNGRRCRCDFASMRCAPGRRPINPTNYRGD